MRTMFFLLSTIVIFPEIHILRVRKNSQVPVDYLPKLNSKQCFIFYFLYLLY